MPITIDNLQDLLNTTLEDIEPNKVTDIATDLQDYTAARRMMTKPMKGKTGDKCRIDLIFKGDGNASATGPYAVDNTNVVDGTKVGYVPWRGNKTSMAIDLDEIAVNSGGEQILDMIKVRRYQRNISMTELFEGQFWDGPSSSSDNVTPFGLLNYWLDYDATTGFNGGNHTNFSSGPAEIDCSDSNYSGWQHYTANYAAVTNADLVAKMRRALKATKFKGIPNAPIKDHAMGDHKHGIYTTVDVQDTLENIARSQNDNLKNEMAMFQENVVIKRIPIEAVWYLQENHSTSSPVIGIDWTTFGVQPLKGRWEVESKFKPKANQHTVLESFLDYRFNVICRDRRRQFLIAKSDPMDD